MENHFYRIMGLEDAARSAAFATLRCLSSDALIARVVALPVDKQSEALTKVLGERELSTDQVGTIERGVRSIAILGERLSSRDKARIDAVVNRLVRLLPVEESSRFAIEELVHKRKARRDIALRVLRRQGVASEVATGLWDLFDKTGDEGLLELIVRTPEVVSVSRPADLLTHLSEPYWKGRVFEALIRHAPELVEKLAHTYPAEFLHGAGRAESSGFASLATTIWRQNASDPVTLKMAVWYFGKIGKSEQVSEIQDRIQQELDKSSAALNSPKG
jgi:hypothetical protein